MNERQLEATAKHRQPSKEVQLEDEVKHQRFSNERSLEGEIKHSQPLNERQLEATAKHRQFSKEKLLEEEVEGNFSFLIQLFGGIPYLCAFSRKIIYPECSVSDNLNIIINVWSWKGHEGTH